MQRKLVWIGLVIVILILSNASLARAQEENLVIVTSNADNGEGTLRLALVDAKPGDLIQFSEDIFPKNAPVTIQLLSDLPALVSGGVTIDASNAGVILDGSNLGGDSQGLRISSNGNTVKGLQIIHFSSDGIAITGGASDNTIGGAGKGEGNIVGANGRSGITVQGEGSDNNRIIGNHIGVDVSGTAALPNAMHGIDISSGPSDTVIGGEFGKEGNVIGGNLSAGILTIGDFNTVIQGNIIGLDVYLRESIPNATCGIVLVGSNGALVGSEDLKDRNIIGGQWTGIDIWGGTTGAQIINNQIGYRSFAGNMQNGIHLRDGSKNNIVGPGNTISYSSRSGIEISGEESLNNTITANSIHDNLNGVIVFNEIAPQSIPIVSIQNITSRSVSGTAAPNAHVEIFSDRDGQARYYEGSVEADEMGNFTFLLPSGSFREKMVSALAINTQGSISALADAQPNPGFGAVRELPNIPSPEQVSTDPVVISSNFIVALISVVFFGFTTSVFNNVVKQFQLQIRGTWEKVVPVKLSKTLAGIKQAELNMRSRSRWHFLALWFAIVLINAVVESFLDPAIGLLDNERLRSVFGLLMAGLIVSGLEWISDLLVHQRLCDQPHARGELRWYGLLTALASMLFSRIVRFTPGYILGTMGTIILLPKLRNREQAGKRAGVVLSAIFVGSLVLWLGSSLLPSALAWMQSLFLNIFTIALQGVLFELLPLEVFDGCDLWRWKKGAWFALFLVVFFAFTHIFLNPSGRDVQALQQNGVQTLLAVMAVYALATFALWLSYKRSNRSQKRAA